MKRRRMDIRLPLGSIARVDRNISSETLAALAEVERLAVAALKEGWKPGEAALAEHGLDRAPAGGASHHGADGGSADGGRRADPPGESP